MTVSKCTQQLILTMNKMRNQASKHQCFIYIFRFIFYYTLYSTVHILQFSCLCSVLLEYPLISVPWAVQWTTVDTGSPVWMHSTAHMLKRPSISTSLFTWAVTSCWRTTPNTFISLRSVRQLWISSLHWFTRCTVRIMLLWLLFCSVSITICSLVKPDSVQISKVNTTAIEWTYPSSWASPYTYFPLTFQIAKLRRGCENCGNPCNHLNSRKVTQSECTVLVLTCLCCRSFLFQ